MVAENHQPLEPAPKPPLLQNTQGAAAFPPSIPSRRRHTTRERQGKEGREGKGDERRGARAKAELPRRTTTSSPEITTRTTRFAAVPRISSASPKEGNMDPRVPRRATKAMRSMVVVSGRSVDDDTKPGTSPSATLVVAPLDFVEGRRVKVCFFDGQTSRAKKVAEDGGFCLLTTKHHTGCEEVSWMELTSPLLTPSPTFLWPPASPGDMSYLTSFTIVESLDSYLMKDYTELKEESKNCFLVSCDYVGQTLNQKNRLTGAPVFALDNGTPHNCAMGVILRDIGPRSGMRLAISSTRFREIVQKLRMMKPMKHTQQNTEAKVEKKSKKEVKKDPPAPPSPPRKKRKRREATKENLVICSVRMKRARDARVLDEARHLGLPD
ncbi:hypothetical protein EJB05_10256, partial [Eragrostis curvula]